MYSKILIRYGELSTKGKNKMTFVRQLGKNIEMKTSEKPIIEYDRMFLNYSIDNIDKLKKIFGIQSFSPVVSVKTNIEIIKEQIKKLCSKYNENLSFKVNVHRHWKGFEKTSMEFTSEMGAYILSINKNLNVDVRNPNLKFEIEIREDQTYLFFERIKGLGGYPVGINGKVLHLISGGIDSPIAALEMIKRGIHVDFLNFITPPHTDQKTLDKVNRIIKLINEYQGPSKLYRSNYTDLMNYIGLTSDQAYKITLMRRSFYRIANIIANKNNYIGISNGENVGQVASQTLESMNVIQSVSNLPIYRPILTSDKLETIEKAKSFGTYSISIEQAEEACELFAPKSPVIKPKIFVANKLENELNQLIEMETENINNKIDVENIK